MIDALVDAVLELRTANTDAVGFGVPARIDSRTGVALGAVNTPLGDIVLAGRPRLPDRAAGRSDQRRQRRRARRVPARRGAGDARPRAAHARNRGRRRPDPRRAALPRLVRGRPHGHRRGRRAVPGLLHGARSRRVVLLRPRRRPARAGGARRRRRRRTTSSSSATRRSAGSGGTSALRSARS